MTDPQPTPAPASDKTTTISKLAVSVIAEITFMVCMGIAYWTKNDTAFNLLVGAAISNSTTVVNYWLGSSSGSSAKDATIAAKTLPPAGTTTTTVTPPTTATTGPTP